jgi:alpha-amylase
VGECWDGTKVIRDWIDGSGKTSAAFDFQFRYSVRNAINNNNWKELGRANGSQNISGTNYPNWPLVSNNYESGAYRQYAVTFVENHDTEKRSNAAQDPIKKDTLAANAYLLAMPGTPCIFMTHWKAYKQEIKAMVQARRLAGITNTSSYSNMRSSKDYYANVIQADGEDRLLVIVGNNTSGYEPSSSQWQEVLSGYKYKYYLSKTLNTPFTDKAAGTFSEPFDVTLTAVTDKADATLVYTTDGSDPSATNGTEAASGTTIKIDKTTTLKVALLKGSSVLSVLMNTYTYQEPETVSIPDFCTVGENEVCAFFEAPAAWDKEVYCWAWANSPAENFTSASGTWPGVACEKIGTTDKGNSVWKWSWDGTKQNSTSLSAPEMIIFSNQGAPQTADLTFANGGYYNEDGLQGTITPTAIRTAKTTGDEAAKIYSLDGRLLRDNGSTSGLPKGIYIVGKKKIILK